MINAKKTKVFLLNISTTMNSQCWFLYEIHHSGMRLETENEVMLCGCDGLSVPSKAQVETESSL